MTTLPQLIEEILPAVEEPPCGGTDEEKWRYAERRRIAEEVFAAIGRYWSPNSVSVATVHAAKKIAEARIVDADEYRTMRRVIRELEDLREWIWRPL